METAARILIRVGSQPEQEYPLTQSITIAGREAINDLVVNDAEVSRRHCRIMLEPEGFLIEDLGSTNGTFVNGQRVTAPMVLYHGDTIELGKSARLVFLGGSPQQTSGRGAPPVAPGIPVPSMAPPTAPPMGANKPSQAPSNFGGQQRYDNPPPAPPPQKPPPSDYSQEYYNRPPQNDPYMVEDDDDEYEEEAGGCQRYFLTCGCLILLGFFLLLATLFILDATVPDFLWCGGLQGFWETIFGPFLDAFDASLNCPAP